MVATAVEAQGAAVESLRTQVDSAYEQAAEEIEETLRSGALLRGEVLARWYEVVGTGEFMRALESRVSWARDRLRSLLTAKPSARRGRHRGRRDGRRVGRARSGGAGRGARRRRLAAAPGRPCALVRAAELETARERAR